MVQPDVAHLKVAPSEPVVDFVAVQAARKRRRLKGVLSELSLRGLIEALARLR